jgi:hypothetical protein
LEKKYQNAGYQRYERLYKIKESYKEYIVVCLEFRNDALELELVAIPDEAEASASGATPKESNIPNVQNTEAYRKQATQFLLQAHSSARSPSSDANWPENGFRSTGDFCCRTAPEAKLMPLPIKPFGANAETQAKVGSDLTFRCDATKYSTPHEYSGKRSRFTPLLIVLRLGINAQPFIQGEHQSISSGTLFAAPAKQAQGHPQRRTA